MTDWNNKRPELVDNVSALGIGKAIYAAPDGNKETARLLVAADGFHFKNSDFDDLKLLSLSMLSPTGSTFSISFDDNGNLQVNGKVYTGPPVTAFQGTITSTSTDFNSLTTEGHYDIRFVPNVQGKNGPQDGDWGLLDVKSAGRMVVQTYYGDTNANVYVRNCHDGTTWTAWREISL